MVRSVTALGVVGVHVAAFTIILIHTPIGIELQNAAITVLHFTREIFIAITGFVMVYIYGGKPFPVRRFWRKRGLGVFLPYVLWSLFYDWYSVPHTSITFFAGRSIADILTGSASFQLYYILLTLEFYLVLPWFLRFIHWSRERPWQVLGASFALQVVILTLDYHFIQSGPFSQTPFGQYLNTYQGRYLPLYQFYMVIGGMGALYIDQLRAFVRTHGRLVLGALALGLALMWGMLVLQVNVLGQSMAYAVSVFQPAMAVYAVGMSLFLYSASYRWATRRAPAAPRAYGFWLLLSDVSFGIYLVHAYFLNITMQSIVPLLPAVIPEPLRVALVWVIVAGESVALCAALLYVPVLSRLVGRPSRTDPSALAGQIANAWRVLRTGATWRMEPVQSKHQDDDTPPVEPASPTQVGERSW
jgi:membrane-bound acyltransferase YfiQ involved in biofilm formation